MNGKKYIYKIIKKEHKTKTRMDPQIFISILKISIFRIIFDRYWASSLSLQSARLFNLQRKETRPKDVEM